MTLKTQRAILSWALSKKNEKGQLITLADHEFQRDIWEDFSLIMAIRKAAQIGISTIFILKCIWLLERYGYNIIYTLPTLQNDVRKFVPAKVDPLLEQNGYKPDKNNMTLKQIGNGFWHFGGTHGEKEGISTTADILLHDEVDRSNLEVVGTYKSRLGHSTYGRRWFFSNPTAPKRGVDEWWLKSDQKHWFLKCECGTGNFGGWQYLDWPQNVDYEGKRYICIHCGREITDDMRRQGKWVAKYPGREVSGYWMSKMIAPWIPCADLINDEMETTPQYFNNFDLGKPYIGADVTINRDMILRNIRADKPDLSNVFFGIDVGGRLHVTIGNDTGITKMLACSWADVEALMNLYQPRQVVIDALPETTKATEFRKNYPGKVKLCYYDTQESARKPKSLDHYEVDYAEQVVLAKRTACIDMVIKDMQAGKINFYMPHNEPMLVGGSGIRKNESYVDHWESMYLMSDEEKGIYTWEHSGPDHFAHSTVYYWIARQIGGSKEKHKVRIN